MLSGSLYLSPLLSSIQLVILFLFLCLSRFGLWSFDLCETQLMQLQVSREHAGVINGSQETLVNVGYIVSFLLTIIFSSPELFAIPAWISFLAVVVSAVCYTNYAGRELGTENPFPPLETFKLHRKVQYDPAMDGLSQQHAEGEEEQKANHGGQYEEHLAPQQQLEDGASMSTEEAASTDPSVFGGRSSYVHHGSYVSASYGESDL